ncbi:MAG: hypothetical protein LUH55_00460 [Bacteroides thetaiotaomicron]|nr:hypothetical protein [Bacteroides thetaiotaomicron]
MLASGGILDVASAALIACLSREKLVDAFPYWTGCILSRPGGQSGKGKSHRVSCFLLTGSVDLPANLCIVVVGERRSEAACFEMDKFVEGSLWEDSELIVKVQSSINRQCYTRGYVAPVDVLMEVGVLDKRKYEDWRTGRVPYLESVCMCNLRKLSLIMKQIRKSAQEAGYRPSFVFTADRA